MVGQPGAVAVELADVKTVVHVSRLLDVEQKTFYALPILEAVVSLDKCA